MKVTLFMAMSLNGIIARKNGDEDFLSHDNWNSFSELVKSFQNFIIGRKTFEAVKKWKDGYNFDDFKDALKVVAIDINEDRLNNARDNAVLFEVAKNTEFKNVNADDLNELKKLGDFDAIYIDVDWREDLSHPIKRQNIDPFKTCPRTDKLYETLRKLHPKTPIIFKISPFVRVKDLTKLDSCVIEELYIDGKFLSYNVYFDPKIKKSRWQAIHLFNKEVI